MTAEIRNKECQSLCNV